MEKLRVWLEVVVRGLVKYPEQVRVAVKEDEEGCFYVIYVSRVDTGRIIGKQGSIAEAVRTIVRAAGYLEDIRASMKIEVNTDFARID